MTGKRKTNPRHLCNSVFKLSSNLDNKLCNEKHSRISSLLFINTWPFFSPHVYFSLICPTSHTFSLHSDKQTSLVAKNEISSRQNSLVLMMPQPNFNWTKTHNFPILSPLMHHKYSVKLATPSSQGGKC